MDNNDAENLRGYSGASGDAVTLHTVYVTLIMC